MLNIHIMFISFKKQTVYKDEKDVTVHVNCSSSIISGTSWYPTYTFKMSQYGDFNCFIKHLC